MPVFAWAFVRWERRLREADRPPLLDVGLLRGLPGYTNGLLVGSTYFAGYTGILLVLSVYLQTGLGYAPLQAGSPAHAVRPRVRDRRPALRAHRAAVRAAPDRDRAGVTMSGVGLMALFVAGHDPSGLAWVAAPLMFLTGFGGGAVVSPNLTLTLADVPPRMGGAAGGALQTGQRIGSAIGAAVLMTVYQATLPSGAGTALRVTLSTALVVLGVALVMSVRAFRHDDGVFDPRSALGRPQREAGDELLSAARRR